MLQSPAVANRVALFGMTALFIALAVPFAIRKNSEWMAVYIRAARDLLAGTDFYTQGFGYLYPPFMALLFAPFICLPELAMRLIWYVVNVLSIIGLIGLSWRLSGGTLFTRIFHDRRSWIAASLGLACSERYISNALNHQQTDILIACLIMAGCFELTRERRLIPLTQVRLYVVGASIPLARAFAWIVSLDDVPIARGLFVSGEPQQRFE
jgi:Glycosyltransferase family 87